jgi:hypothetical protein
MALDPASPWSWDSFDTGNVPRVDAPAPFKPKERTFPDEDKLFKIQKDALRAAQGAQELRRALERGGGEAARARLLRDLVDDTEDTYRAIRSYLDRYVNNNPAVL